MNKWCIMWILVLRIKLMPFPVDPCVTVSRNAMMSALAIYGPLVEHPWSFNIPLAVGRRLNIYVSVSYVSVATFTATQWGWDREGAAMLYNGDPTDQLHHIISLLDTL